MAIRKSSISGGSGSNGFSLLVGSSGNTTFTFDTDQPAGAYSVSSELSDTTFDIYLVTSGNESAGYTNSGVLDATLAFNRVVVYGGTENDVLSFITPANAPATKGDVADGAAPFLTSATPTTLASVDDTTTVTGGNFATDVGISFTGQDSVILPAKSVVRSSSTELIVTRPDSFLVAQEPFTMTATNVGITNPSVTVNKLTDYFDAGSGLVWATASPLPQFATGSAYSVTLEATDADGTATTYAKTAGSFPAGVSLDSSTGVLSGTPTGASTETFTVLATDAGGNSSSKEFVLFPTINVDYLVIAGGGGGGGGGTFSGSSGGGGAGGFRTAEAIALTPATNYTVTVGAGGAFGLTSGTNGSKGIDSVFSTVTSTGGGGGGANQSGPGGNAGSPGGSGGSGGGAGYGTTSKSGGSGNTPSTSPAQGFNGQGMPGGAGFAGGGGGGASEAGGTDAIKDGGDGESSSITGTAVTYAGGGGGGSEGGTTGQGGTGGGGAGGNNSSGIVGTVNTGGGGGGGGGSTSSSRTGGNGGSGTVIIKYPDDYTLTIGGGLTSSTPAAAGGFKVTTFTAGTDNISFA